MIIYLIDLDKVHLTGMIRGVKKLEAADTPSVTLLFYYIKKKYDPESSTIADSACTQS